MQEREIQMRLIIVRHGDPDYSIDSLTEKGWKEVEYLSEKLSKFDVKEFYVSPLGRAKDTASLTLKKMNRTAVECDWLREFIFIIYHRALYSNIPSCLFFIKMLSYLLAYFFLSFRYILNHSHYSHKNSFLRYYFLKLFFLFDDFTIIIWYTESIIKRNFTVTLLSIIERKKS